MNIKNIKLIYIKNILFFLLFGLIIAFSSTYIQYSMKYEEMNERFIKDSRAVSNGIKLQIKEYIDNVETSIESMQLNRLFIKYLQSPNKTNKMIVDEVFMNTMKNNKNFFQFRFIDKKGLEKIRVDRKRNTNNVFIVEESKLQDKSKRYYFSETVDNKKGLYWHSSLDLNIENKKIEKPIRPTFRVSSKVLYKGEFYGILIVNIELAPLLAKIRENEYFDIFIIDSDGYFIVNPSIEKEWSKYLETGYTIDSVLPNYKQDILDGKNIYFYQLSQYFKNNEDISLILKVKDYYLENIKHNNETASLYIGLLTLLISVPIGLLISAPISKLFIEFNKIYKENLKYIETIDKHIATAKLGLDRKFFDVSTALCEVSGYTKEELIGKELRVLKSDNIEDSIYDELWSMVSNGFIWSGELENRKKTGEFYWVKATVLPIFERSDIKGYTLISENINEKKIIEKISQVDKLTQLYNRVKLDDILENEFNRYKRNKSEFSLVLIDVDDFKLVNEKYGHFIGDKVLVQVANIIKNSSRKTDIIGRWTGEEFLIICLNTKLDGALLLAEKLRSNISNCLFEVVYRKTVSIGVTQIGANDNLEDLMSKINGNLLKAKQLGGNKIYSDQ